MTDSFRPQARPVDTYVVPSQVAPVDQSGGALGQLTRSLVTLNPAINKYIDMKLDDAIEDEQAEGIEQAIEDSATDFKQISKSINKKDGPKAARQLIGGSIFAQKAYERTKAEILGNSVSARLQNTYSSTIINGKSLANFSVDSPEFQNWLTTENDQIINQLNDINPVYVKKYFLPKLTEATGTVTAHHIKTYNENRFEQLKTLTVPLVQQVLSLDVEQSKPLIARFELSMNNLGIISKDRQDINTLIVDLLFDEAEAVGLNGNGDLEGATDILETANLFPYGPGGKLNLTSHPKYQEKLNKLKRTINNYTWTKSQRNNLENKRLQEEDIVNTLKKFAETNDSKLIEDLMIRQPLKANAISINAVALDGDSRENYAQILKRIQLGDFYSKSDAVITAFNWFQDPRTPNTEQNRNLLLKLIKEASGVESGQYTFINKNLTELKGQIKNELSNVPGALFFDSGQLKGQSASKLNSLFNQVSDDYYEWYESFVEENNRSPSKSQQRKKYKELRNEILKEAREWKPTSSITSGIDDDNNINKGLEGPANKNKTSDQDSPSEVNNEGYSPGDWYEDDSGKIYILQDFGKWTPSRRQGSGNKVTKPVSNQANEEKTDNNSENINQGLEGPVSSRWMPQSGTLIAGDLQPGMLQKNKPMTIEEAAATLPPIISDGPKQQAIAKIAKELGIRPQDLAAVISKETSGTFSPSIIGTDKKTKKKYLGLIQLGEWEQKHYGTKPDMSFEEQMVIVGKFLKDRGVEPGHGIKEIYAAILTGNVINIKDGGLDWKDSNGTSVNSSLPELTSGGDHYTNGLKFLQSKS